MSDVFGSLERIDFKPGDILLRQGDPGYHFLIIQEGQAEIYVTDTNGIRLDLGIAEPGQPVGEFALISQSRRSANVRAISSGFAIKISEEAYKELLTELPEWAQAVIASLVKRLQDISQALLKEKSIGASEVTAITNRPQ
ncbi:MAG: cyclic nucleotide-binding domain-containing protein [Bdellovibrionales bacterium]|nr:cyclic nucleotide-binding domain-containing protein [Bdellovibrionales bacterium]